nr:MAG TPA: hypothetical protein [Caudoviricetes sp.]
MIRWLLIRVCIYREWQLLLLCICEYIKRRFDTTL